MAPVGTSKRKEILTPKITELIANKLVKRI